MANIEVIAEDDHVVLKVTWETGVPPGPRAVHEKLIGLDPGFAHALADMINLAANGAEADDPLIP